MTIKYHTDLEQGSDAWLAARCGLLTASEMKNLISPKTYKISSNDKGRAHLYEIAAQRISKYVEPHYISDDMLRGHVDEVKAKILYAKHYAEVQEVGFITNDKWGFKLGFSPDGLVGEDGIIECKSRRQKFQIETILNGTVPIEHVIQVQAGLLISERKWCDFITYSGGLPMYTVRVYPDEEIQLAIFEAAEAFEENVKTMVESYKSKLESKEMRFIPTERDKPEEEIVL